jgi:hypothetical protein
MPPSLTGDDTDHPRFDVYPLPATGLSARSEVIADRLRHASDSPLPDFCRYDGLSEQRSRTGRMSVGQIRAFAVQPEDIEGGYHLNGLVSRCPLFWRGYSEADQPLTARLRHAELSARAGPDIRLRAIAAVQPSSVVS